MIEYVASARFLVQVMHDDHSYYSLICNQACRVYIELPPPSAEARDDSTPAIISSPSVQVQPSEYAQLGDGRFAATVLQCEVEVAKAVKLTGKKLESSEFIKTFGGSMTRSGSDSELRSEPSRRKSSFLLLGLVDVLCVE